ncbi:MAG: 5-bromo-4-chloroindolyl phosphate hydrolysis family protein [Lachnospiraceae bacterium]|nr:5-bromo-4-chloroindolyl phosphate hydrolysis family protein [Lachnospiraceae bacterium]
MAAGKGNNYLGEIGKQIVSSLGDGLQTGDFSGLNRAISDSVETVLRDSLRTGYDAFSRATKTSEYDPRNAAEGSKTREYQERIYREHVERDEAIRRQKKAAEEAEKRRAANDPNRPVPGQYKKVKNALTVPGTFQAVGSVSNNICIVGGAVGMAVFGVRTLLHIIGSLLSFSSISGLLFPAALFFISAGVFTAGLRNKGLLTRAKRYAEICGAQMYTSIAKLSSSVGMKPKQVVKDIKRMLKKGFYPEGFIDEQETTLMLSRSVYDEYLRLERERKEELKKQESAEMDASQQSEFDAMLSEGEASVKRLRKLNDRIPGEVISGKLFELERLLKEIFARVKEHPEQMERMHKLMEYYLPTTIKLVEAYEEYDKVSAPGEEILSAKAEIEKTLDTINDAFVQLLNKLFQDSVWDVTSDAKVLETLLKQDGLA